VGPPARGRATIFPAVVHPSRTAAPRVLGLAIPLALALAPAAGVRAQHVPAAGPDARPLHERLALADAVAFASVAAVGRGRVRFERAEAVRGAVAARFETKRAPSRPPRLEPGERVLLLLRGARSPYLLVDTADEIVRPADAAEETAWRRAVRQADRARRRGADVLAERYLAWIASGPPSLRRAALRALGDRQGLFPRLPAEAARRVAEVATDPAFAEDVRVAAAETAVADPRARALLWAALPGGAGAHPGVLGVALRAVGSVDAAARERLLLDALGHPDPAIRRAALRVGPVAWEGPALRRALERCAAEDADAELRALARRALERLDARP